jgi:predicted MFS family arabinose efflux permease
MADRYAIAPMLIPIAATFQVSLAAASGAASLYYLAYGLMPLLYGLLADRFGRVRIIRAALAGMVLADILAALSPNLPTLLLARFVAGGIACGVFPTTLVYLGDRFAFAVRQQAITKVLASVALGTAAGTIVGGLVAHAFSWRLFFVLPALVAVVVTIALGGIPESLVARSSGNPWQQVRRVLRHGWAWILLALALVQGSAMFGLVTYLAPALESAGQSAAIAGSVVAGYGLSVLACTRAVNRLAARVPAAALLGTGAAMLLLGYVLAAATQTVASILAASLLAGGAYAFMQSTFQAWFTDVVPEARGTATALFATAIFGGAALATWSVAGLANAHAYRALFIIGAAITVPLLAGGTLARSRYQGSPPVEAPTG